MAAAVCLEIAERLKHILRGGIGKSAKSSFHDIADNVSLAAYNRNRR